MNRLFILLLIIIVFALKSDAVDKQECNWEGIEIDTQGCVNLYWYDLALKHSCSNLPPCFKIRVEELPKEKPKKKEYFSSEDSAERQKIIPILDNSAVALLKNNNLKNIKIIFYNKGKLTKEFQSEAEGYLLDKGVKRDQFIIEIK